MATPLDKWKAYREEDKHECSLFSARMTALLTSQSFLVAAAAAFASNIPGKGAGDQQAMFWVVILISVISLITAFYIGRALIIGCRILDGLHEYGERLKSDPAHFTPTAQPEVSLDGCYPVRMQPDGAVQRTPNGCPVPERTLPDRLHDISLSWLAWLLSGSFVLFWVVVIVWVALLLAGVRA